jgi:1,4-alpha-glucan branching enzyme
MATKKAPQAKTVKKGNGSSKKKLPSTEFTLFAPEAKEVFLVGEFNNWDPNGFRMRRFKDGTCKKAVQLKPGRYEYRFLVDGQWWTDPANGERTANSFGSENSVININ